MKYRLLLLALLSVLVISCTKEDDVTPIIDVNNDTVPEDNDSTLSNNYCVIGADTIHFTKVIKWKELSNRVHCRYDFFADNPTMGAVVLRFINDSDELSDTTTYNDGSDSWVNLNGSFYDFEYFTVVVKSVGGVYDIDMEGRIENGVDVKLHYQDVLIDENIITGNGYMMMGGDSVSLLQLCEQPSGQYMLCDPTDATHFEPMRVYIKGITTSGLYDLAESPNIKVTVKTGLFLTTGVKQYDLDFGTLQFSNNGGRFSIICHGSSTAGSVDFEYEGTCFNNIGNPISLDILW